MFDMLFVNQHDTPHVHTQEPIDHRITGSSECDLSLSLFLSLSLSLSVLSSLLSAVAMRLGRSKRRERRHGRTSSRARERHLLIVSLVSKASGNDTCGLSLCVKFFTIVTNRMTGCHDVIMPSPSKMMQLQRRMMMMMVID